MPEHQVGKVYRIIGTKRDFDLAFGGGDWARESMEECNNQLVMVIKYDDERWYSEVHAVCVLLTGQRKGRNYWFYEHMLHDICIFGGGGDETVNGKEKSEEG